MFPFTTQPKTQPRYEIEYTVAGTVRRDWKPYISRTAVDKRIKVIKAAYQPESIEVKEIGGK